MTDFERRKASWKQAEKYPAHIRGFVGGPYTAFVAGRGFRCSTSLRRVLEFIRITTGIKSGAVPFFNINTCEWDSEFDLAEGL